MAVRTYDGRTYDSYNDYLKTDHWQTLRIQFLGKQGHKGCSICRSTENLSVTHKRFTRCVTINGKRIPNKSILGKERFNDLRALCRQCHDIVHGYNLYDLLRKNKILNIYQLDAAVKGKIASTKKRDDSNGNC